MNIAFFVSAHGFGHAARAAAVMSALREHRPGCVLEIFSRVPEWFFSDTLGPSFQYHSETTDVGVVQKDPFTGDAEATLDRLGTFLPFSEAGVRDLAAGLAARDCRAVVCDISPLGIAVARQAGVPSILVENFTWDWIYEPYLSAYPGFKSHIEALTSLFSKADVHLQTEPVCRPAAGAERLHPISRPPRNGAATTRRALGVSDARPLVLLSTGGVAVRHRFLSRLEAYPRVTFVVPHDVPQPSRRKNVIVLPHQSDFYHPDLVRAADLVVGKLGYSTLAEVGHAGKPFGYVLREDSVESGPLGEYTARHLKGRAVTEEEFSSGHWLRSLDELLAISSSTAPAFPNDAMGAAKRILEAASDGAAGARREPSKRFDPFNDRTSRDIRNRLSEALVKALHQKDPGAVQREVDALGSLADQGVYRHYIEDRRQRYRQVLEKIEARKIDDPKQQAMVIFNAGLFFECHDHLEVLWSHAVGPERKALQGLIQAAGVFVHRQMEHDSAAEKLSTRAVRLIEENRRQFAFIANLEDLIAALKQQGAQAPRLKGN
jgi:hypothetical protein